VRRLAFLEGLLICIGAGLLWGLLRALGEAVLQGYPALGYWHTLALLMRGRLPEGILLGGILALGLQAMVLLFRWITGSWPDREALLDRLARPGLLRQLVVAAPTLLLLVLGVACGWRGRLWFSVFAATGMLAGGALASVALAHGVARRRRGHMGPGSGAALLAGEAALLLLLAGAGALMLHSGLHWTRAESRLQLLALLGAAGWVGLLAALGLRGPVRAGRVAALAGVLALLSLGPAVWVWWSRGAVQVKRPANIVLIGIDTLRADATSVIPGEGDPRGLTPNLAALARRGVAFRRAIAQAPWTLPSFASIMTGLYPAIHGATSLRGMLRPRESTLAEVLREAGYRTGAVVSHDYVARKHGFGQGFDDFDESNIRGARAITSEGVTDRALEWLHLRSRSPFFLFVHYFDCHDEYQDHPEQPYADGYQGWLRQDSRNITNLRHKRHLFGPAEIQWLRDLYAEEVAHTDREIGRLLEGIEQLRPGGSTAIVVVADHGEELLERGWLGHTTSLHQELVRVPLVMVLPGVVPAGTVVGRVVETRAIRGTLLDYLGAEGPGADTGQSLLPVLRGEREGSGEAFSMVWLDEPACRHHGKCMTLSALQSGPWQLIADRTRGRLELYDLDRDPAERRDRSEWEVGRRHVLEERLQAWEQLMRAGKPAAPGPPLSDPERRRLQALGYL